MSVPSQKKAAGIVMIHNHPCGEMKPSAHDLDATDRMIQVGRILDIHVVDHLIISERQYCGYYSFEDHRIMEKLRKSVKYIPSFEVKQNFKKKLETIHKAFKEEIKLTKIKSKELGKKQGEKIGLEKGKLEIAKMMLEAGKPVEKIIRFTGLSEPDIQQLS